MPVGQHPAGRSAWGIDDLLGNGWEWTSTVFAPFPGFTPMPAYPEYSADFFDGKHYVMKGASPVTARDLLRRSFRNWFRPHYPVCLRVVPLRLGASVMSSPSRSAAAGLATARDVEEIHYYLNLTPRQLPSRLLYDALGSTLFDAICLLPWYRITRAEAGLLAAHGAAIGALASPTEVVELGCGNGDKIVALLGALPKPAPAVQLIDVSAEALARTTLALHTVGVTAVTAVQATYEDGLMQLPVASAASTPPHPVPRVEHRELRPAGGIGVPAPGAKGAGAA